MLRRILLYLAAAAALYIGHLEYKDFVGGLEAQSQVHYGENQRAVVDAKAHAAQDGIERALVRQRSIEMDARSIDRARSRE
jgi:hypothetical protein